LASFKSSDAQASNDAARLFEELALACAAAVARATANMPFGEEKQQLRREQRLLEMITALERKLVAPPNQTVDANDVAAFAKKYRAQARAHFQTIALHHIDAQKKVSLERIYVAPTFASLPRTSAGNQLTLGEVMSAVYRSVILGMPGGGKSTFATKVALELVSQPGERLVSGRSLLPILVVLRDYGTWRRQRNSLVSEYIEQRCTLQVPAPQGAIQRLLETGAFLVIFDGLDELLNTADRRAIRDEVESFCALYSDVPVVVTSREVGYDQAPLSSNVFDTFAISGFSDAQTAEYASKWFALDEHDPAEAQAIANRFLRDSAIAPDLRSTL
jgi:predicted NACHT family NTPase